MFAKMIVDLKDMRCHKPAHLKGRKIYELVDVDVCPDGDARLVDECKLQTDQCHQHAQCSDRKDGYVCSCQAGFTGDGKQCLDINECKLGRQCVENSKCMNTLGSYLCICNEGFVKNNLTCDDIDECRDGTALCHRDAACENIPGNYTCTCKPGYYGKNGQDCIREGR
mgnify:CR=1 FL=1